MPHNWPGTFVEAPQHRGTRKHLTATANTYGFGPYAPPIEEQIKAGLVEFDPVPQGALVGGRGGQYLPTGASKVLKKCTYPLIAPRRVTTIVTDLAVMDVVQEGLRLREVVPGVNVQEVRAVTEANLIVEGDVPEMAF